MNRNERCGEWSFKEGFKLLQSDIHSNSVKKGFWRFPKEHQFVEKIALIHSELSEALEAHRKGDHRHITEELADVFIRLLDLAEAMEYPLWEAIEKKMIKNTKRGYRHGKKY